jgi:dipeptidyl aminopeptidase/acylaminoacyl peptidase
LEYGNMPPKAQAHVPQVGFPLLLASIVVAATLPATRAAEEPWEELPGGVMGRLAMFEGVGGVKIAGYVRRPAGAGPFPIVILLHGGGPTAKVVRAETEESRAKAIGDEAVRASRQLGAAKNSPIPEFLAQGWAVYSIDYRTNPRYTLDLLEWDDTTVAVTKARSFPFVDSRRIAMLGGSHGGHVTARMASRTKLACAVLCAPAGLDLRSLDRLAKQGTPIGGNARLIRELEQRAGTTLTEIEQNPDAYHYSSPLTEVGKVQCPVLMISGRNDPNAPVAVMDAYVDALRATGREVEAYHPDNGPHGFYFGVPKVIPETAESTGRAVAFIKKHFDAAGR